MKTLMKTLAFSFLLLANVNFVNAQAPCPEGLGAGTNMGAGDCKSCNGTPNDRDFDFSQKATAKIVLEFDEPLPCTPRLMRITKPSGEFRIAACGVGEVKQGGSTNGTTLVEYCFWSDDEFFKDRTFLSATIKYDCNGIVRTCPLDGSEESPLPVTFKSVNANRKNASSVGVTWTTSSEQNNRGFNVQRNDGSGWKTVAFVFSQSVAGTSKADLSYEYNDANTITGVSQYRIQQVDLDGKASFSIIRAVRGEGIAAKILVYPNPSATGNINVVFDNNTGVRDVMVSDAAGRLVKSFKSITNNILLIENLGKGFYTLKVINRTTEFSSVEKVVVK